MIVTSLVVYTVEVVDRLPPAGGAGGGVVWLPETGHTVVYNAMVETITRVERAGQSVTVAGHWVMV